MFQADRPPMPARRAGQACLLAATLALMFPLAGCDDAAANGEQTDAAPAMVKQAASETAPPPRAIKFQPINGAEEIRPLGRLGAAFARIIKPCDRAAPGMRATASGFKTEINAKKWRVTKTRHRMDKNGGFSTDIETETA